MHNLVHNLHAPDGTLLWCCFLEFHTQTDVYEFVYARDDVCVHAGNNLSGVLSEVFAVLSWQHQILINRAWLEWCRLYVYIHRQQQRALPSCLRQHNVISSNNVVKQWHSDANGDLGACRFIVSGLWDVDFIYQLVFSLLLSKHYKTTYLDNVWLTDVVMLVLVRVVLENAWFFRQIQ